MKSIFEEMGGTYTSCGDYFLPNIKLSHENRTIGFWGRQRKNYLQKHRSLLFSMMVLDGSLYSHLADIDEQSRQMESALVAQLKSQEGITEQLKAASPLCWVTSMNNITGRVREIIFSQIICA